MRARDDLEEAVRTRAAELQRSTRTTEVELAHHAPLTTRGEVTASFAHELKQPPVNLR